MFSKQAERTKQKNKQQKNKQKAHNITTPKTFQKTQRTKEKQQKTTNKNVTLQKLTRQEPLQHKKIELELTKTNRCKKKEGTQTHTPPNQPQKN